MTIFAPLRIFPLAFVVLLNYKRDMDGGNEADADRRHGNERT